MGKKRSTESLEIRKYILARCNLGVFRDIISEEVTRIFGESADGLVGLIMVDNQFLTISILENQRMLSQIQIFQKYGNFWKLMGDLRYER